MKKTLAASLIKSAIAEVTSELLPSWLITTGNSAGEGRNLTNLTDLI